MAVLLTSCARTAAPSGQPLSLGGSQQMVEGAAGAWADIKRKQRISTDPRYTSRLHRVAPRMIQAAGSDPSQWEYLVFDSDARDAYALPGGKMGINRGLLDNMENDAQLAAVLGYLMVHVKLRHGAERFYQGGRGRRAIADIGAAGVGLCRDLPGGEDKMACQQSFGRWVQALGLGTVYGSALPYSAAHIRQADRGAVRYMVLAGYDPQEAVDFWRNMARMSEGASSPPRLLLTHPLTNKRMENLMRDITKLGYAVE